jgi:uncharacterized protein YjiS (DUF1127 family)
MASLIRRTSHWFGGRASARAHRTPVDLDDHMLRDIGLTRMEYHFLHMSGPAGARDAGAQIKRSARLHAVGEDQSLPSRFGLELV